MIPILFEDNHLLVVNKPCGMATMGDDVRQTVHQSLCDYLRVTYSKPGKVFLGVVHRLDALASGVLVMARTSKAASRLSEQFRTEATEGKSAESAPRKEYLVLVEAKLETTSEYTLLTDYVRKNEALHRMETVSLGSAKTDLAKLRYRVLKQFKSRTGSTCSLLQVQLLTGRKHQIRLQLSSRGMPVFGDKKYGGAKVHSEAIALHAWKLTIQHPTLKQSMTFNAPPPTLWTQWCPDFRPLPFE